VHRLCWQDNVALHSVLFLFESNLLASLCALQCNFAYLNTSTNVVELRRADRNFEDVGPTLCKMLDGQAIPSFPNHTVAVKYATEHRCGVRVRGPGLSDNVTGTDPLKDNLPLRKSVALDSSEEAVLTARLVNTLSRHMTQKLQEHVVNRQRIQQGKPPANCVLLRGCGARVQVPTFVEKHGLASFMIAPTCLIRGLGISLEMDIIDVPGGPTCNPPPDTCQLLQTAHATLAHTCSPPMRHLPTPLTLHATPPGTCNYPRDTSRYL
jgi:2,3-diphosphopglycerate-independent phosphoglycerate mutase